MDRIKRYRELQRSVPDLETMYASISAYLSKYVSKNDRVLVVGAGGGREIEMFAALDQQLSITAIDPSRENLEGARHVASDHAPSDA